MARKDTDIERNMIFDFGDRFVQCYPAGRIEVVPTNLIPAIAKELFESRSSILVHPDSHEKGDFFGYVKVTHIDGSVSWVAWRKPFLHNPNQWTFGLEMGIYCQDLDSVGQPIGWGEIAYWLTNSGTFFHDKPFLASSNTEKKFQRQGYDERRVIMMNAVCELFFGLPLYSSDLFLPQEDTGVRAHEKTWERLVKDGVAQHFKDNKDNDRYVFKRGAKAWKLLPGVLTRISDRREKT